MKHPTLCVVVVTALLAAGVGVSSAQWCPQNNATILKTTNGGSNWNLVQTAVRPDLTSMSSIDAVHRWVFASRGDIPTSLVPQPSGSGKLALAKKTHTADTFYLPDTVIAYGTSDTTRFTYSYDTGGNMLTMSVETWNGTQWVNRYRSTYTYDTSGNVLTTLSESWDGTQWVNGYRSTNTYDASGNVLTNLGESWDGTQWVNGYRSTNTYDASGNVLTNLSESWDGTQWVNGQRFTYSYDTGGNMLTMSVETWNGTQWVNRNRSTNTYDTSGNVLTNLSEDWNGTQWVGFVRSTNTYDASGNVLTNLSESWDGTQWVNGQRFTYSYDTGGNMLTMSVETWDGTQWVNISRLTNTYDASRNVLTNLSESWDGTQWANDFRSTNTYDANGNVLLFNAEIWLGSTWAPADGPLAFSSGKNFYYFDGYQITLGYTEITTSLVAQREGPATSYELSQNYPNPFNPSTTICYALPSRSHVTLAVFNTLGQQVAMIVQEEQGAGYHEVQFDASGLASGVYLYRLVAGEYIQTKKFVLVR